METNTQAYFDSLLMLQNLFFFLDQNKLECSSFLTCSDMFNYLPYPQLCHKAEMTCQEQKHSSLFCRFVGDEGKKSFMRLTLEMLRLSVVFVIRL